MMEVSDIKKSLYFKVLERPNTKEEVPIMQTNFDPSWMDSIIQFLEEGVLPTNHKEAKRLKHKAPSTSLHDLRWKAI